MRLNTGERGIVSETSNEDVESATIRILYDEKGNELKQIKELNTHNEKSKTIVKVLDNI